MVSIMDRELYIVIVRTAEGMRYEVMAAPIVPLEIPRVVERFYDLEDARAYVRKHQVLERRRID